MAYVLAVFIGGFAGAICVYLALENRRKKLEDMRHQQVAHAQKLQETIKAIKEREHKSAEEFKEKQQKFIDAYNSKYRQLEILEISRDEKWKEIAQEIARIEAAKSEFASRVISYEKLQDENRITKRDLLTLEINLGKLKLDEKSNREMVESLNQRSNDLATRYLKENVKWISQSLSPDNYLNCKKRLQDAIERCRDVGYHIGEQEEKSHIRDLKSEFEKVVRAAFEREEQTRIRAQIREEQQREKEIAREMVRLEQQREAVKAALDKALAEAHDEHSAEIEDLKARLAEAEAKSERAIAQAQLTRSGHVYVISNIGSLGDGIFKIGMTRRIEPLDRIKELGDASVPFPFDIHMMISSDDAPALENSPTALHKLRINKINLRKEFFKSDIETISEIVKKHHGHIEYVADAEAMEFRQSQTMAEEDLEFIEHTYDRLQDDGDEQDEAA